MNTDNETVKKILDGELSWALFKYDKGIQTFASGNKDLEELKNHLDETLVLYGYIRVAIGSDKRTKFVFIKWVGENVRPIQRARAFDEGRKVTEVVKVYHIELPATKKSDLIEKSMIDRLTAAAGANYDKEQNTIVKESALELSGYKKSSKQFFQQIEKGGTVKKVVYETKALPKTTPVDLGNRQMTVGAATARSNTVDLNIRKE